MWESLMRSMYQNASGQCRDAAEHVWLSIHFFNVAQGLQCTGLTEDDPETDEMLPSLWNSNSQVYSFRYSVGGGCSLYLKGVKLSETALMLHAMRSDKSEAIHNLNLDLKAAAERLAAGEDFVKFAIESVLPLYREQVYVKVKSQPKSSLLIEEHRPPFRPPLRGHDDIYNPYGGYMPHPQPFGRGDLMPGGLGGNLVGPDNPMFRQPGNPLYGPGLGNPMFPGVRFDPIDPFDPQGRRRGGPSPDHFAPPGPRGPFF
jgi:hypothetical protein